MKKILLFAVSFWMTLVVTACVDPITPGPVVSQLPDKAGLALNVSCNKISTKADIVYREGESKYNENTLKSIDWFIFPSAVARDSTTKAVMHGRVSWTNNEHDNAIEEFLAKTVRMDEYLNLAGCGTTGYVYVLANLPDMYTHVEDEVADATYTGGIQYVVGNETVTVNNLKDLTLLSLTANFNSFASNEGASPDDYTAVHFVEQASFVMQSSLLPFTIEENARTVKVTAPLSRVAAKITLDIDLASAIDQIKAKMVGRDTTTIEYVQTWYPESDKIQIYMTYANSKTTVAGSPKKYESTTFFTYNRYAFVPTVTQSVVPSSIDYSTHPSLIYHDVQGTPFYSYPLSWETVDTHAPFIKIIIPWTAYEEEVEYQNHDYIKHNSDGQVWHGDTLKTVSRNRFASTITQEGTKEFYYKILIPVDELKLQSNNWYKIALDVAVLGSRSDDLSTILSGRYFVVDWGNPDQAAGGILDQGRYLSVADTLYTMNAITSIDIPVSSSHPITTDLVRMNGTTVIANSSGQGLRWRNRAWEPVTRGSTRVNGRSSFTFTDALNTTVGESMDCYPMRFVVRVRHTDKINTSEEAEYTRYVAIVQYPSIYVDLKSGGPSFVDGYYGRVNSSYAEPGNTSTYNPTFNINSNNPTYNNNNNGPFIVFNNATVGGSNNNRRYTMGNAGTPGTITITAPTGGTITNITIGYYQNANSQAVTFNDVSGSKTTWTGSESKVVVSMACPNNNQNRNVVNSISVTYSTSAQTGPSGNNTGNYNATPYGNITQYVNSQTDMTVISISAFGSNSSSYTVRSYPNNTTNYTDYTRSYLIADPRENADFDNSDLVPYFTGSGTSAWGDTAEEILWGSMSNPNYISPRFMIASTWGRQVAGNTSFENTQKRCATYQEAGYPAGRWRLPTEAEVNFIYMLQDYHFIGSLFNSGQNGARYWISDGHSIRSYGLVNGKADVRVYENASQDGSNYFGQSSRCVYDLWYWGENPVTPIDQYHIAP